MAVAAAKTMKTTTRVTRSDTKHNTDTHRGDDDYDKANTAGEGNVYRRGKKFRFADRRTGGSEA